MRALAPLLLLAAACGEAGVAPLLSELTFSRPIVARGEPFYATVHATDADGDLDRGLIRAVATGALAQDDPLEMETELDISGVPGGAQEAELILGLYVTGELPLGPYDLRLWVTDGAGNESQPALGRFQLR